MIHKISLGACDPTAHMPNPPTDIKLFFNVLQQIIQQSTSSFISLDEDIYLHINFQKNNQNHRTEYPDQTIFDNIRTLEK